MDKKLFYRKQLNYVIYNPKTRKLCINDDFAKPQTRGKIPNFYYMKKNYAYLSTLKESETTECHPALKNRDILGRIYKIQPNNSE